MQENDDIIAGYEANHKPFKVIDNTKEKIYEYTKCDKKFDIFIDFSGMKYEWNKIIVDKITKILDENSIIYWNCY